MINNVSHISIDVSFPWLHTLYSNVQRNLFMMMSQHSNLKVPQAQVGKYLPKFHLWLPLASHKPQILVSMAHQEGSDPQGLRASWFAASKPEPHLAPISNILGLPERPEEMSSCISGHRIGRQNSRTDCYPHLILNCDRSIGVSELLSVAEEISLTYLEYSNELTPIRISHSHQDC